jgi:uncharacterized protein (TIGR00369 family)
MPSADDMGFVCTAVADGTATVTWSYDTRWTRPGDYISGPLLMSLADTALYCAVFGALGRIEPMAVTSEMTTHFLRPAKGGDVTAEATLLRVSDRVAYGEVLMSVAGDLVAHTTGTYIVPG